MDREVKTHFGLIALVLTLGTTLNGCGTPNTDRGGKCATDNDCTTTNDAGVKSASCSTFGFCDRICTQDADCTVAGHRCIQQNPNTPSTKVCEECGPGAPCPDGEHCSTLGMCVGNYTPPTTETPVDMTASRGDMAANQRCSQYLSCATLTPNTKPGGTCGVITPTPAEYDAASALLGCVEKWFCPHACAGGAGPTCNKCITENWDDSLCKTQRAACP